MTPNEKLQEAVRILEAAHNDLLAIKMIRDEPGYYKLVDAQCTVARALREVKVATFENIWRETRGRYKLQNAKKDDEAKAALLKSFLAQDGMDCTPLFLYFDERKHLAGGLALAAILKEARKALPRIPNGDWRKRDATVDDFLHGKRVQLRVYRRAYSEQLECERLDALEKLACILVWGQPAESVTAGRLSRIYGYRQWDADDGIEGKRDIGGPFVAARSYKNGRFDLFFKTEDDARKFAEALTGEDTP